MGHINSELFERYNGKVIDERYKIQELIGVGGMAMVFKATDLLMGRDVAVKILKEEFLNDEQLLKRFENESRAVAMLSHPNIVNIYDVSLSGKLKYIVMEYIDGITMKAYLEQEKTLAWKEAVYYVVRVLHGLDHAHSKGVIHRDVKPHNIMLLKDGSIKITDFGIAMIPQSEPVTLVDTTIGTVQYVSPEQARGRKIEKTSDLYSLGVMLYEMVTGKLPFEDENPVTVALKHVNEAPVPPRKLNKALPRGLEQIILHAMEKDPASRYQSAKEMCDDINTLRQKPNALFRFEKLEKVQAEKPKKTNPQNKKRSLLPVLLGIFSSFGVVALSLLIFLLLVAPSMLGIGTAQRVEDLLMPDFEGKTLQQIQGDIRAGNLRIFETLYEYSNEYEEGKIIAQTPNAGTLIKRNADVSLVISKGSQYVLVPAWDAALSADEAEAMIVKAGLKCERISQYDEAVAAGRVISCIPAQGKQAERGSTVKLYVSAGKEVKYTSMPYVIGLEQNEAVTRIMRSFLEPVVTVVDSDRPAGEVIDQSVEYGAIVQQKAEVEIKVSNGVLYVEPDPPVTEEPPVTEPPVTEEPSKTEDPWYPVTEPDPPVTEEPDPPIVNGDGTVTRTVVIDIPNAGDSFLVRVKKGGLVVYEQTHSGTDRQIIFEYTDRGLVYLDVYVAGSFLGRYEVDCR